MTWAWLGGFVLFGVHLLIFAVLLGIKDELYEIRKLKEKEEEK